MPDRSMRRWTVVDRRTSKIERRCFFYGSAVAAALIADQVEDVRKGKVWPTPRHREVRRA